MKKAPRGTLQAIKYGPVVTAQPGKPWLIYDHPCFSEQKEIKMNVDREQQREILNLLFEHYPWKTNAVAARIRQLIQEDRERTIGNILYLQKHGLIDKYIEIRDTDVFEDCEAVDRALGDPIGTKTPYTIVASHPTISAKGIDFLLGDEGLSSILNTHTVKIEANSARLIVDYFISQSDLSDEKKSSLLQKVKSIPSVVLQESLTKLLVEKIPYQAVLDALKNML